MDDFGELSHGDEIEYVGPEDLPGGWAAPLDRNQPYEFQHVSVGGTLTCHTRFGGKKRLSPEHPANDPARWDRITGGA